MMIARAAVFLIVCSWLLVMQGFVHAESDRSADWNGLLLVNTTPFAVTQIYASRVSKKVWEENILGDDKVPPRYSVLLVLNDGSGHCLFDIKLVFSNGANVERQRVNVCKPLLWIARESEVELPKPIAPQRPLPQVPTIAH